VYVNINLICISIFLSSFLLQKFLRKKIPEKVHKVMKLPSDSCTCGLRSFTHWKDCASLHPLDFIKKAITNAADLVECFDKISQISAVIWKTITLNENLSNVHTYFSLTYNAQGHVLSPFHIVLKFNRTSIRCEWSYREAD
jgi:hypothetical protein